MVYSNYNSIRSKVCDKNNLVCSGNLVCNHSLACSHNQVYWPDDLVCNQDAIHCLLMALTVLCRQIYFLETVLMVCFPHPLIHDYRHHHHCHEKIFVLKRC